MDGRSSPFFFVLQLLLHDHCEKCNWMNALKPLHYFEISKFLKIFLILTEISFVENTGLFPELYLIKVLKPFSKIEFDRAWVPNCTWTWSTIYQYLCSKTLFLIVLKTQFCIVPHWEIHPLKYKIRDLVCFYKLALAKTKILEQIQGLGFTLLWAASHIKNRETKNLPDASPTSSSLSFTKPIPSSSFNRLNGAFECLACKMKQLWMVPT